MVMGRLGGLVVAALALLAAGAVSAAPPAAPEALCATETSRFERHYGIPQRLLDAISVVESGRYNAENRAVLAWPWTVTAEGNGRYFPTKDEAVAEVKRLKARGVRNIDVGCMQVNLHWHPDAFNSLDEAFEPASNVAYAARFLKGLFEATNHWVTAASYYHSQTPHLAAAYRQRLMKVLDAGGTALARAEVKPPPPPVSGGPQYRPVPSNPSVQAMRESWKEQNTVNRNEARRIADAYRKARLAEYQLRRAKMVEYRRAVGLSGDGY